MLILCLPRSVSFVMCSLLNKIKEELQTISQQQKIYKIKLQSSVLTLPIFAQDHARLNANMKECCYQVTSLLYCADMTHILLQLLQIQILFSVLLPQVKTRICISDFMQATFFYLGRFLKKLADDQCSSITKGSVYHIKHIYIQPFTTVVDWPEIWCLMEVSTMFYICRYCVFTWCGRVILV